QLKERGDEFYETATKSKAYLNENTPLNFTIVAHNNDFELSIMHSTAVIEVEESDKLFEYFKNILDQILQDVDQEPKNDIILIESEHHKLTEHFNDTNISYDTETTVLDLFKAQVKQSPNRIAITFEEAN